MLPISFLNTILKIIWIYKEGVEKLLSYKKQWFQVKTYTHSPLSETLALRSESHEYNFHVEIHLFWNFFGDSLESFIVSSLKFPFWYIQFITSYRTHRALINTVWMKWLEISILYVKCIKLWTLTEQNAACMMLTHISSQINLRSSCLISVIIIKNK